jgi:hypothetical protein
MKLDESMDVVNVKVRPKTSTHARSNLNNGAMGLSYNDFRAKGTLKKDTTGTHLLKSPPKILPHDQFSGSLFKSSKRIK